MVVVSMGPTRRIDLTRGNAHGPKGGDTKGRFLSATANCRAHRRKGRMCAAVGGLIGDFFMTPVVYFHDCVFHRHPFDAIFQFIIENFPVIVKILVVYSEGYDEMEEFFLGNLLPPRHFFAGFKRHIDIMAEEVPGIIGRVSQRHIFV